MRFGFSRRLLKRSACSGCGRRQLCVAGFAGETAVPPSVARGLRSCGRTPTLCGGVRRLGGSRRAAERSGVHGGCGAGASRHGSPDGGSERDRR